MRFRFEIYCGKKQHSVEGEHHADVKSGPAAVVRNLKALLHGNTSPAYHLVVTDRFYTSPSLAMQLLAMKIYAVGTCMTNRYAVCLCCMSMLYGSPLMLYAILYEGLASRWFSFLNERSEHHPQREEPMSWQHAKAFHFSMRPCGGITNLSPFSVLVEAAQPNAWFAESQMASKSRSRVQSS